MGAFLCNISKCCRRESEAAVPDSERFKVMPGSALLDMEYCFDSYVSSRSKPTTLCSSTICFETDTEMLLCSLSPEDENTKDFSSSATTQGRR